MNSREHILNVLLKLDNDLSFVNHALNDELLSRDISDVDRGFIYEIVMGCVKNRELLDFYIMQFSKTKIKKMSNSVRNILEMGVYQIVFLDKVPNSAACNESVKLAKRYASRSSGFINGVLRNLVRNIDDLKQPQRGTTVLENIKYLSTKYSYPEWMTKMLISQYGLEGCEKIFSAANKSYSPMIRANILKPELKENGKFSEEKFISLLKTDGIKVCQDEEIETIFHVESRLDINNSKTYKSGVFTLQNRSSYLAVQALNPKKNEFIIDMCSAPGGKTTAMAELMENEGRILAFDIHEHKIKLIMNAAKRLNINIIEAKQQDSSMIGDEYYQAADRVLLDAPCSGLGVLHTKPDIRRSRKESDIDELVKIQSSLLDAAAKVLKHGGCLVYSTCTILNRENEMQIRNFLNRHDEFVLEYEKQLLTHESGGSGFYIARLKKN